MRSDRLPPAAPVRWRTAKGKRGAAALLAHDPRQLEMFPRELAERLPVDAPSALEVASADGTTPSTIPSDP